MEHAIQLPKLNIAGTLVSHPKHLEPIEPSTTFNEPFTLPKWCSQQKPQSISLLDVYKDNELLTTYTVDQKSFYLIGRNAVVCDIVLNHCSISRLHASIIHHQEGCTYLVDLGSGHGTFVDEIPLRALQPTLIVHGSVLKFGASSRSYFFKSFESREQIIEIVHSRIGLEKDEIELQKNTMLNRAISYRIGFSPRISEDEPMMTNEEEQKKHDGVCDGGGGVLCLKGELGRKRARSLNNSTFLNFRMQFSTETKRVQFTSNPPDLIPSFASQYTSPVPSFSPATSPPPAPSLVPMTPDPGSDSNSRNLTLSFTSPSNGQANVEMTA